MLWLSAGAGYVVGSILTGLLMLFFLGARGPR